MSVDRNIYRDGFLRFSIQKPNDWHFVSFAEFEKALDKQEQGLSDPGALQAIRDLGTPILVMAKYPMEYEGYGE